MGIEIRYDDSTVNAKAAQIVDRLASAHERQYGTEVKLVNQFLQDGNR